LEEHLSIVVSCQLVTSRHWLATYNVVLEKIRQQSISRQS